MTLLTPGRGFDSPFRPEFCRRQVGGSIPASGMNFAERSGAERSGAERSGAERSGAERSGAERSGAERSGVERSGVERSGAEWSGVLFTHKNLSLVLPHFPDMAPPAP